MTREDEDNETLFTLSYQLSLQDYIDAKRPSIFYFWGVLFFSWLLACSYASFFPDLANEQIDLFSRNHLAVSFYGTSIAAFFISQVFHSKYSFIYRWSARRSWRDSKFSKNPQCIQFTRFGISIAYENKIEEREWSQYNDYEERDRIILISYFSQNHENYHIIPKKNIATVADLQLIRRILKENRVVTYSWK